MPAFDTLLEGGTPLGVHRYRRRRRGLHAPAHPERAPSSCVQSVFAGAGNSNFCDLASGEWVPMYTVKEDDDMGTQCSQLCLPVENSLPLAEILHAEIGLCCMQGPGYNDFQGSINELIPGIPPLRIWNYGPGDAAF